MNLLQRAAERLSQRQSTSTDVLVTYARGLSSDQLMATTSMNRREQANASGAMILDERRDYTIAIADLQSLLGVIDPGNLDPQEGDQVTEGSAIYEVMSLPGEPCFQSIGSQSVRYRIHTKRVSNG